MTGDGKQTWDESESLWERRYDILSKAIGIPPSQIKEARSQIGVAFGTDWLRQRYENAAPKSGRVSQLVIPEIETLYANAAEHSAVQLVELAAYLSELRGQSNLAQVIDMLRTSSMFEAGRLNLAVAFRLSKAGLRNLVLEPATPRGQGDVAGLFKGKNLLVECSIVGDENFARRVVDDIWERSNAGLEKPVYSIGIEVIFSKPLTIELLNDTIKQIKDAKYRYGNPKNKQQPVSFSGQAANGRVFRLSEGDKLVPDGENPWDAIMQYAIATLADENDIHTAQHDVSENVFGRLFVRGIEPEKKPKTLAERVDARLSDKLSQTHGVANDTLRLFVFEVDAPIDKLDHNSIGKLLAIKFKTRPNVAAVILVRRRQFGVGGKRREGYDMAPFFNPLAAPKQMSELLSDLAKLERKDWLVDDEPYSADGENSSDRTSPQT